MNLAEPGTCLHHKAICIRAPGQRSWAVPTWCPVREVCGSQGQCVWGAFQGWLYTSAVSGMVEWTGYWMGSQKTRVLCPALLMTSWVSQDATHTPQTHTHSLVSLAYKLFGAVTVSYGVSARGPWS